MIKWIVDDKIYIEIVHLIYCTEIFDCEIVTLKLDSFTFYTVYIHLKVLKSYMESACAYISTVAINLPSFWCYFQLDGALNSLENHPLQLDSVSSSGGLHTLSAVNSDSKKGARDPDSVTGGAGSHGACLTLNDHDHIRQFIQEFTFRGLLPHIEKNIRQLNDQVQQCRYRHFIISCVVRLLMLL